MSVLPAIHAIGSMISDMTTKPAMPIRHPYASFRICPIGAAISAPQPYSMVKDVKVYGGSSTNTMFNGDPIFGATLTVAVGDYPAVFLAIGQVDATTLMGGAPVNLLSAAAAATELGKIQTALDNLSALRGQFGATQQQLTSLSNSLGIQAENFTAAYSQIRDANIADEVVALNKFQVLNQSGTSALGQANQASQSILRLLQ